MNVNKNDSSQLYNSNSGTYNTNNNEDESLDSREVLIVAYYFPPMGLSGVQRTLKFVKYLPKYHWKPIVLTTSSTNYYAFDESLLEDINKENTKIYRTEKDPFQFKKNKINKLVNYPSRIKQILFRRISQTILIPDSRIGWKKYAVELGSKIIEENPNIKIIYATAPPYTDFLVAKELSIKHNIPFVVDYRDLWADNAYFYHATHFHKIKSLKLETEVLRFAQKSFVITRALKEKMLKRFKFLSHSDVGILPHGFDEEDFIPAKYIKPMSNKFVITHSGVFSDDITPKYFLKALKEFLLDNPEAEKYIEARFIGVMRKSHSKLITKLKLDEYVTQLGYVPHQKVIENLMQSDILWMMIPNDIATPSRFYEYIGARKPLIVCAPEGGIKNIASEYRAAITCAPNSIIEIKAALEKFHELWKLKKLPLPDEKYVMQYDRKYLTSLLAKEISLSSKY